MGLVFIGFPNLGAKQKAGNSLVFLQQTSSWCESLQVPQLAPLMGP